MITILDDYVVNFVSWMYLATRYFAESIFKNSQDINGKMLFYSDAICLRRLQLLPIDFTAQYIQL